MRSLPENLAALFALSENIVVTDRLRFELTNYRLFLDIVQQTIAGQTAGKRLCIFFEIISQVQLVQLFRSDLAVQAAAVRDFLYMQQTTVAGKDNTLFPQGASDNIRIIEVALVKNIETQQTKVSSQPAQVNIRDILQLRRGAESYRTRCGYWRSNRVNIDVLGVEQVSVEINGCFINEDTTHFGMRNMVCFNSVFNRRFPVERIRDFPVCF